MTRLLGSSLLSGNNNIPGAVMPDELKVLLPRIFQEVKDYGCDYYDSIVEILRDDEISEVVAYNGFPVRYPHWRFGMTYEEFQTQYELGISKIYELVSNTDPTHIYCLSSNTLVDNVMVIAHALGHSDFFKNNIHFSHTNTGMLNTMANNGSRIRKYMDRWGKERVTEFIDHVLRLDNLIDPAMGWKKQQFKSEIIGDHRKYHFPRRLQVDRDYMEDWINPPEWIEKENERIREIELSENLELFNEPTRDILGFLRDNAPLKTWQQDVVSILYDEALYFKPQITTKTINEGHASKVDYEIMAGRGLCSLGQASESCGVIEFAKHKAGVLGGKYSLNPYKLGFNLFMDIEERWNKGKFGEEWESCSDIMEKEKWDKKLGLGKEKIFEVRKYYNDYMFINEFFTEEFCNKYEFFEWEKNATGEYVITSRDYKPIKKKLLRRFLNGGNPEVKLVDPNFLGKGFLLLQHEWDGRELYLPYLKSVLASIRSIWNDMVILATRNKDGEETIWTTDSDNEDEVESVSRAEFEKTWFKG
jgi:stage V sporulation protein R